MIELLGFKKLGERIKEIEKTVGYVSYPCDCATEMGKFAQEQFQLDLRTIKIEVETFLWHCISSDDYPKSPKQVDIDRFKALVSAIHSALEHKREGSE